MTTAITTLLFTVTTKSRRSKKIPQIEFIQLLDNSFNVQFCPGCLKVAIDRIHYSYIQTVSVKQHVYFKNMKHFIELTLIYPIS